MIEFSEMRGPNKIFGSFCEINEPNILFGPLISENSIVKPPLIARFFTNFVHCLVYDAYALLHFLSMYLSIFGKFIRSTEIIISNTFAQFSILKLGQPSIAKVGIVKVCIKIIK